MLFEKERDTKPGNKAVLGIVDTRNHMESVVQRLKDAGFRNSDISVLTPEQNTTVGTVASQALKLDKETKAPEGATTGGTAGMTIGGVVGWLVGAGALAIPGIGPFVAAGPIMAAIAGAGIGGAVGGVTGALVGLGIPEYEAEQYESAVKAGGTLVSVHVDDDDWCDKAKNLLEAEGVRDISTAREKHDSKGSLFNRDRSA